MTKIITYNLNGLRSSLKKGLGDWLNQNLADIYCFQEIKTDKEILATIDFAPKGYELFSLPAEKKGYSGVSILTKIKPKNILYGCGNQLYDSEGRFIWLDFGTWKLLNVYVPSGTTGEIRQKVKDEFMVYFTNYINEIKKTQPNLILVGDFNIAHQAVDIHNPVGNKKTSGFLPHEREWFGQFLETGFVDAFRHLNPDAKDCYTWWSTRANARANNKGWRIDYHLVSQPIADKMKKVIIYPEVSFSDHCPSVLEINLEK